MSDKEDSSKLAYWIDRLGSKISVAHAGIIVHATLLRVMTCTGISEPFLLYCDAGDHGKILCSPLEVMLEVKTRE